MIASEVVNVNENGPDGLLHRGDHFHDSPHNRQRTSNGTCPMDAMLKSVQEQGLSRPPVSRNWFEIDLNSIRKILETSIVISLKNLVIRVS